MTVLSAAALFEMEFLHEDNMELASSPHMPPDDLDLDLETAREPEPGSHDSMVDDGQYNVSGLSTARSDDDEMIDEDTGIQQYPDHVFDLSMENEEDTILEDEDILYEDEEASKEQEADHPEHQATETLEPVQPQEHVEALTEKVDFNNVRTEDDLTTTEPHLGTDFLGPSESHGSVKNEELYQQTFEEYQHDPSQAQHNEENNAAHEPYMEDTSQDHSLENNENVAQASTYDTVEPGIDTQDTNSNTNPTDPVEYAGIISKEDSLDHTDLHQTLSVALHPVKVIYQDSEISLFSPQTNDPADTFFLSEESLAYESLDKLLASCRDVLADSIGDDDELVLDIASLGLHISEGTKYAAEITLSQILDVYLTLTRNENLEPIEPLYCNLSSRICLQTQYAYLAAAAQEGKTISEIIAEHMDSPEVDPLDEQNELVEEEYEDNEAQREPIEDGPSTTDAEASTYQLEEAENDTEKANTLQTDNYEEIQGNHPIAEEEDIPSTAQQDTLLVSTDPDDAGVKPPDTEYGEDIDEELQEDQDQNAQAGELDEPEQFDHPSTHDENTSSGTIEADAEGDEQAYTEEIEEYEESLTEVHVHEDLNNLHEDEGAEGKIEELTSPSLENGRHLDSVSGHLKLENDNAEDYLDLGLEDEAQAQSPRPDIKGDNGADANDIEGFERTEDKFIDTDASTDQTLDHAPEDNDFDFFPTPTTPAQTRSAKRRIELQEEEDDDDFGLLDTETPEKKRKRPS